MASTMKIFSVMLLLGMVSTAYSVSGSTGCFSDPYHYCDGGVPVSRCNLNDGVQNCYDKTDETDFCMGEYA